MSTLRNQFNHIVVPLYFLAERLSNFTISVSSKFNAENFKATKWRTCSHVPGRLEAGETRTIVCNETITGRFVSLHLNNEGILTICELQVEGRQKSQTKIEGLILNGNLYLILLILKIKLCILEPTRNRFSLFIYSNHVRV